MADVPVWLDAIIQGGSLVLLAGVLAGGGWLLYQVLNKMKQREQDRADAAQAFVQELVTRANQTNEATLQRLQGIAEASTKADMQVAQALQAVQHSLDDQLQAQREHDKEAQERGRALAAVLERICVRFDADR